MTDIPEATGTRLARAIERSARLDRYADALGRRAGAVLPGGRAGAELRGRSLGHPLHAVLTDLPLGLWISAAMLDAVGGPARAGAARRLVGLGVLTAAPTAAAGLADFGRLSAAGRRVATVHAALNTAAVVLYAFSWLFRGTRHRGLAVVVSTAGLATVNASGFLGGHIAHHRHEPPAPTP